MVLYLCRMWKKVLVTCGALVAHHYSCAPAPLRCRTSQYRRAFILFSMSLWHDLADPVFSGVELSGFKSRPMLIYWPKLIYPFLSSNYFSLLSVYRFVLCAGVFGLIGSRSFTPFFTADYFTNNNIDASFFFKSAKWFFHSIVNIFVVSTHVPVDFIFQKLRGAVLTALEEHGVTMKNRLFKLCFKKLFAVCRPFAADVVGRGSTSRNLEKIALAHVKQVIDFEKKLGKNK